MGKVQVTRSREQVHQVNCRLTLDLMAEVKTAAKDRGWSITTLITKALRHYLDALTPVEELVWLKPNVGKGAVEIERHGDSTPHRRVLISDGDQTHVIESEGEAVLSSMEEWSGGGDRDC